MKKHVSSNTAFPLLIFKVNFNDHIEECDKISIWTCLSDTWKYWSWSQGEAIEIDLEALETKEKRIRSFLLAISFCDFKFKIESREEVLVLVNEAKRF